MSLMEVCLVSIKQTKLFLPIMLRSDLLLQANSTCYLYRSLGRKRDSFHICRPLMVTYTHASKWLFYALDNALACIISKIHISIFCSHDGISSQLHTYLE